MFALVSCITATVCVEFCCSFYFWYEEIWSRYTRPDGFALASTGYFLSTSHTNYEHCMIIFKCLHSSAPAYLTHFCTRTSLVPGRSALRSAARVDSAVPGHQTDWAFEIFFMYIVYFLTNRTKLASNAVQNQHKTNNYAPEDRCQQCEIYYYYYYY